MLRSVQRKTEYKHEKRNIKIKRCALFKKLISKSPNKTTKKRHKGTWSRRTQTTVWKEYRVNNQNGEKDKTVFTQGADYKM